MKARMGVVPVVMVVFAVAVLFGGCPQQPDPTEDVLLPGPPLPDVEEPTPEAEPSTLTEAVGMVTPPTSYEAILKFDDEEITQLVLLEDAKPAQIVIHQDDAVVYVDLAGKKMTMHDPSDGSSFEMDLDETFDTDDMVFTAEMLEQDVPILGVEDVDGVSCWVVETTAVDEEDMVKVWIDREFGLIRQVQDDDETMTFSYSRINEVPESEFEVPGS